MLSELSGAGDVRGVVTDVSSEDSVNALADEVYAAHGACHLLFNNAGTAAPAVPLDELSVDQWKTVVDVNLTGVFLCTQHAFRLMKNQQPRGGRIINNGSISAHQAIIWSSPYRTVSRSPNPGLRR